MTARARLEGKPPCGAVHVKRTFVAWPTTIVKVAGVAVRRHLGTIAVTVMDTVAVCEIPPPVAVTVTLYVPLGALLLD